MVDRMVKLDLRVITIDVPRQDVMTRDNVPVAVDAVLYFRVVDPVAAVVKVENYLRYFAHGADHFPQRPRPGRTRRTLRSTRSINQHYRKSSTSTPTRA